MIPGGRARGGGGLTLTLCAIYGTSFTCRRICTYSRATYDTYIELYLKEYLPHALRSRVQMISVPHGIRILFLNAQNRRVFFKLFLPNAQCRSAAVASRQIG